MKILEFFTGGTESGQSWLKGALYVCVILNGIRRADACLSEIGREVALDDTFSVLQNLRILAQLEKLGTSVVREFDSVQLRKVLQLPKVYLPVAVVTIVIQLINQNFHLGSLIRTLSIKGVLMIDNERRCF
ncbi:hypothetical protein ACFQ3N_11245 [Virgibacillus byunsanensis]|uniref:Tn3 transposase DDE domain-containing protein n=1 Tax=Virgibacillus byunsanensis TaxID=570945 RepID=A0ABW3LNB7_9BACI